MPPPGYEDHQIKVTIGDDFDEDRTFTKVPKGQAVAQATWTVKRASDLYTPGDVTAVWQKTVTPAANANVGVIRQTGINGTAKIHFEGIYLDSLLLSPGTEYVYDMQVVSTAGKQHTFESGTLTAVQQTTQT